MQITMFKQKNRSGRPRNVVLSIILLFAIDYIKEVDGGCYEDQRPHVCGLLRSQQLVNSSIIFGRWQRDTMYMQCVWLRPDNTPYFTTTATAILDPEDWEGLLGYDVNISSMGFAPGSPCVSDTAGPLIGFACDVPPTPPAVAFDLPNDIFMVRHWCW